MFPKLFIERGLSLDRLRALVEVGAFGSIVRAADGDPVRQSQYSRQIKELEDFFKVKLTERQGKGIRLTPPGKELARISRFFLLGLSNFLRGARAEEQTFRIGACATCIHHLLIPRLTAFSRSRPPASYAFEVADDDEIERRLHDLTLDFGMVNRPTLSRPLQAQRLKSWRLFLCVPKDLGRDRRRVLRELNAGRLPYIHVKDEMPPLSQECAPPHLPSLQCGSFVEAKTALEQGGLAAMLPDFIARELPADTYHCMAFPSACFPASSFHLAWNPRLLRLNPQAIHHRDLLLERLAAMGGD